MKKLIQLDTQTLSDLQQLESDGETGLMAILLDSYSTQAPAFLSHLQRAVSEKDFSSLERTAHSFKSSSAGLGAQDLAKVLANLEQMAEDHASIAECAKLVNEASLLIQPTLEALKLALQPKAA